MIEKKTSYLIAMPIELGALAYDYPLKDAKKLFNFGLCIGKAFQIQDDFLEIMSSPEIMKKSGWGQFLSNCVSRWVEWELKKKITKFKIMTNKYK